MEKKKYKFELELDVVEYSNLKYYLLKSEIKYKEENK